jgi:flagellar basal body-associated protein FliL
MIKKVRLDIFAPFEGEDIPGEVAEIEKEITGHEEPDVHSRWYPGKRFMLLTLVGVTLLAVSLSSLGIYLWMQDKKTKEAARAKMQDPAIAGLKEPVAKLTGFMVNIKDSKGNQRILVCDIWLELGAGRQGKEIEDRIDVRNTIYTMAKSKSASTWVSPGERQSIKKEIYSRLNSLLGEGVVKTVYFVRVEVL